MKLYQRFKKTIAVTAVSTTLLAAMPVTTFAADYNGHWAETTINEWKDKGVIDGYEDGSFKPKQEVTRAEFAKMLVQIFGLTNKGGAEKYKDVASDKWYANDIALVSAAGLMLGTEDNNFRPNDKATREEACYALATAYHITGNTTKIFEDHDAIADWAVDSVDALVSNGYINGYPEDGTFRPQGKLTRAEAVTMLDKITAEIVNTAGTYTQDIQGNLVVNKKDVILKDMTINGNLYLAEGIGEGDVTIENVRVTGRTIVEGGGANSVKLVNTQLGKVEVNKSKGLVRIAGDSKSSIDTMKVESAVQLEGKMGTIEVATKEAVKLVNAVIKEMQVTTEGAKVDLDAKTVVDTFIADEKVEVSGKGQIKEAEINADGVEFKDRKPDKTVTTPGVKEPSMPSTPSGGGGGGSDDSDGGTVEKVKVQSITVEDQKVTTGSAIQLTADVKVTPNTSGNKKVTWKFKEGSDKPEGSTLSLDGYFEAGNTTGSAIVIATSVKDPSKFDEATIEITGKGDSEVPKDEVITGEEAEAYVKAQDFGYGEAVGDSPEYYNVGFQLQGVTATNADSIYGAISQIEVKLFADGTEIANRVTVDGGVAKLQADDKTYGGYDGQLSASFKARAEEESNEYWKSSKYDFATPERVEIRVSVRNAEGGTTTYVVENTNLYPTKPEAPKDQEITGEEAEKYVRAQDFSYGKDSSEYYNVGFQLQEVTDATYDEISQIEVKLFAEGEEIANRVTVEGGVEALRKIDKEDGKFDGQLSASFKARAGEDSNAYWKSSAYDFTTPERAEIRVSVRNVEGGITTYIVENTNLYPTKPEAPKDQEITGEEAEKYVRAQDFSYGKDSSEYYNVGFQLQEVTDATYDEISQIEVKLFAEGEEIANRVTVEGGVEALRKIDKEDGKFDGQLSASFKARAGEDSNAYWKSSAYDFTTPERAEIRVSVRNAEGGITTYIVENTNLYPTKPEAPKDQEITGEEAEKYVRAQDFSYGKDSSEYYNVGFQLQEVTDATYDEISQIEVKLFAEGEEIANRVTVEGGVEALRKIDKEDGKFDGQLSASFKARAGEDSNAYWKSSAYDFTTPERAEIRVSVRNAEGGITTYIVENTNLYPTKPEAPKDQEITGEEAEKYVRAQDFSYGKDSSEYYNVGFQLQEVTDATYDEISQIEVKLFAEGEEIANRVTVEGGVEALRKIDKEDGKFDGQLSASFKARAGEDSNAYWKSSAYDFTTPERAEIRISVRNAEGGITTYIVENENLYPVKP